MKNASNQEKRDFSFLREKSFHGGIAFLLKEKKRSLALKKR